MLETVSVETQSVQFLQITEGSSINRDNLVVHEVQNPEVLKASEVILADVCEVVCVQVQSFCALWYISWHVSECESMAVHSGARAGTVRRTRSRVTRENKGAQQTPNT